MWNVFAARTCAAMLAMPALSGPSTLNAAVVDTAAATTAATAAATTVTVAAAAVVAVASATVSVAAVVVVATMAAAQQFSSCGDDKWSELVISTSLF